jgi:hypothetical protein
VQGIADREPCCWPQVQVALMTVLASVLPQVPQAAVRSRYQQALKILTVRNPLRPSPRDGDSYDPHTLHHAGLHNTSRAACRG